MVCHSFRKQEWFDDVLQVPYILPHRIVRHRYIDKSKILHSEPGKEVYKEI